MAGKPGRLPRKTTSGIAGASGGTGLIGFAALIPDNYHFLKQVLIYISPSVSILIGFIWAAASEFAVHKIREWQFDRGLAAARSLRDAIVNDPGASQAHKDQAQEKVEKLEQLKFSVIDGETKAIYATVAQFGTHNPSDPG